MRAQRKSLKPSIGRDGPMVLLDHVIQVLDLTNRDGRLPLGVHRVQRGQIRAAFVDGYRLRHTILSDRLFKEAPCCHLVPLGSEQEINGFTRLVDRPVEIPPLAFDSDIRFVHPPALAHRPLVTAKRLLEQRHQFNHPAMYR
jgi:hypothetical protein